MKEGNWFMTVFIWAYLLMKRKFSQIPGIVELPVFLTQSMSKKWFKKLIKKYIEDVQRSEMPYIWVKKSNQILMLVWVTQMMQVKDLINEAQVSKPRNRLNRITVGWTMHSYHFSFHNQLKEMYFMFIFKRHK